MTLNAEQVVVALTKEALNAHPNVWEKGYIVKHPASERHGVGCNPCPCGRPTVLIVSGEYMGHGGLSNFWYWRPIFANGDLGKMEHGYGRRAE